MKFKYLILVGLVVVFGIGTIGVVLSRKDTNTKATNTDTEFSSKWGEKKLVVGIDDAFPPNTFRDETGQLVGLDIDLAKEASKRLGVEIEFQPVEWDGIIPALESKRIDIIWSGMGITTERKERVNFVVVDKGKGGVFFVKANSSINSKSDLSGKVVGVQAGSYQEKDLKADPIANSLKEIRSMPSLPESILDLRSGRVDAVLAGETSALYYIQKTFGSTNEFRMVDAGYSDMYSGIAIRKDDKFLKENLDIVVKAMIDDGTAGEITKKWLGIDKYADWDWSNVNP